MAQTVIGDSVQQEGLKVNGPINNSTPSGGLLLGSGTSASPVTTSTADAKFIEYRCKTTATSGDNRLIYLRYEIAAAGGGECVRAFTKLTGASGTVRGAHLSLDIDGGSASGLGVGVDSQILLGNAALSGGTYAVSNLEAYASGTSTDVAGVTEFSFQRLVLGGNATGLAAVEDAAYATVITGGTNASGNLVGAVGNEPTWTSKTYLVRGKLNGTVAYQVWVAP